MQRLIKFPCRLTTLVYSRTVTQDANYTNRTVRMGLPFLFDENQALNYFNRWRKSFWLAPNDWQQISVKITRHYLPYWSFSFEGNVYAEAYIKSGSWLWGGAEWHPLSNQLSLTNIKLSNINIYAAHTYDREHINEIDMKMDDKLQSIDISLLNDDIIEEWTVDRDTAFEIGWHLTIVNKIQELFLQKLNQEKKQEYRFTSIRFPIDKETQQLIYFPIYIINYQYRNRQFQCLINGRTGKVAGLRQFSRFKIMAMILGIIYPACVLSFASTLSFTYYTFSQRFIIVPFILLITGVTFPFVTTVSIQMGRYIRDYSHLYRGKRDIRAWLDFKKQNPYFFTDKYTNQKDSPPIFDRQRTQEPKKPTMSFDINHDLYSLLGVSRFVSNSDIKRAYLLKAKEFHPDRNVGNKQIEEKFKLINQAYAILSDPEQRQIFDEYGYEHVKYK